MASVIYDGAFGYNDASKATVSAVASKLDTTHGFGGAVTADLDAIMWLPGLIPALHHITRVAVARRRDKPGGGNAATTAVATATPVYYRFLFVGECEGVDVLRAPLRSESVAPSEIRFEIDFDALEDALKRDECGALLWCSPHNPTGRVWSRDELARVARLCVEHDVLLLSDEVWADVVFDEASTPFVGMGALVDKVPGLRERLVVVSSPSKTYNVATCDVAYAAVLDPALRRDFARAGRDKAETPPFGFAAALAAYTHPGCASWRRRLVDYLRANRDHAHEVLTRAVGPDHLRLVRPEATFLSWVDVSGLGIKPAPSLHFQRHGVALTPGPPYGGDGFVRLNFATPRATLDRGLERFLRGVDNALAQARG